MSTKIFYAYRLKKKYPLMDMLLDLKEIAMRAVSEDGEYLRLVHIHSILWMFKEYLTTNKIKYKECAEEYLKDKNINRIDRVIIDWYQKEHNNQSRFALDVNLYCSIFFDNRYWYLKFYPNMNLEYKILKEWLKKYPEIEDFHYQNSTDPPEDISYREYEARDKKWDQLLRGTDRFIDGLVFTAFNYETFDTLLTKFYWTGKPLYDHLAYKFDKTFDIDINEMESELKENPNLNYDDAF